MVREDYFETMSHEQSQVKMLGPPMYMSGGKNISGRGTRKCKALELGTDLVMFQKQNKKKTS